MWRAALSEYYDQFVKSFRSFEKLPKTYIKLTLNTYIFIIVSIISAALFNIVKLAKSRIL